MTASETPSDPPRHHLALIRHGAYQQQPNAPSAWQPWPLNAEGEAQCREGGKKVAEAAEQLGLSIASQIHCSTLLRARQTAYLVADALKLDSPHFETSDQLTERSVGAAANLSLEQIEAALALDPDAASPPGDWKRDPDYRLPFPGAESLRDAGERVAHYLTAIVAQPIADNQLTLVVGHGASLRHAVAALGIFSSIEAGAVSMYHAQPIILCRDAAGWRKVAGDWKPRDGSGQLD